MTASASQPDTQNMQISLSTESEMYPAPLRYIEDVAFFPAEHLSADFDFQNPVNHKIVFIISQRPCKIGMIQLHDSRPMRGAS